MVLAATSVLVILWAFWIPAAAQDAAEAKLQTVREAPPYWAFAVDPPADSSKSAAKPDGSPRHVPGSAAVFSEAQVHDFFNPPDWHPEGHPAMPEVVGHGRAAVVFACGFCHLPNGQGRPENASLAGLPAGYIAQQVADFKSGVRKSSEPRHKPAARMASVATMANDKEVQAAAEYFSGLKPIPWIRVVETATVPHTHVAGWMLIVSDGGGLEPIGSRIIETPENLEQTELRDDHSGFIAYVPVGSVKSGEALVSTGGGGRTIQCAICHGQQLKGLGNVPGLAGRSPSYIVRQLYDMQGGARAGEAAALMKAVVEKLSVDDMVRIAAYTASLRP